MDSFVSETDDMQLNTLSMSLVSYGSDLEGSLDVSTSNLKTRIINSISDTDTVIEDDLSAPDETVVDPILKRCQHLSATGLSERKKKEVEIILAEEEAMKKEYLETVEVLEVLRNVILLENFPQPTKDIAQKLLVREDIKCYLSANDRTGLLGLNEDHLWTDCPRQLSETDQKITRLAVQSQLIQNARELKLIESSKQEALMKISGCGTHLMNCKLESGHTTRMALLRNESGSELEKYYKNLIEIDSLLESIVQMKTNKINDSCLKIIESYEVKVQLLKQKIRLITAQIQSAVYKEDESIVPGMQCLQKDLDVLFSEIEADLSKASGLLTQYERIKGPQYSSILDEYQDIRKQIISVKYVLGKVNECL